MAAPIGPGDWVECLRTWSPSPGESRAGFQVGGLYCVADVSDARPCDECGRCGGLTFRGIARGHWFIACAFRPIYRPDSDLIESLKAPAPEAVRELISEEA